MLHFLYVLWFICSLYFFDDGIECGSHEEGYKLDSCVVRGFTGKSIPSLSRKKDIQDTRVLTFDKGLTQLTRHFWGS